MSSMAQRFETMMEMYERLLDDLASDIPTGQKHKKLNQFVRKVLEMKFDPIALVSTCTDFWSKKVRLDIAEASQDSLNILELLKSDEKIFINRILQFNWLFVDGSVLSDPKYLTTNLFPNISCLCRQKIIRKLSNNLQDEQNCEKLYEAIESLYGVETVQGLLPKCGSEFISAVLSTRKVQLSNRQLLIVVKRFTEIGITYLKTFFRSKQTKGPALPWTSCPSTDFYNRTLKFLAGDNCLHFMNIYEAFSELISGLGLSLRATSRLIKFDIQRILKMPKVYVNLLNKEFLQKRLTQEQFETFFIGILPVTIQHFRRNICDLLLWLTTFSPNRKGVILKFGFHVAYSQNLVDRIDCIAPDIVQYFEPDERMRIADFKLNQELLEEGDNIDYYESSSKHYESFWTAFKTIQHSVPHIKELLHAESDSVLRSEFIVQLVRSCKINESEVTLGEICKFVAQRHRNENLQVHIDFLEAVDQNFEILKLENTHWDSMREIIELCLLASDLRRYSFILNDILEKGFIYFIKHNLPLKSILRALIQMKTDINWGSNWRMETLKKKEYKHFEKSFLQLAAQEIESKYSAEDSTQDPQKQKSILALANGFLEWNKSCSGEDQLSFTKFPWLLDQLVELFESDDQFNIASASRLLMSDPLLEKNEYIDQILKVYPTERMLLYCLKKDTKKVLDNVGNWLKFILRNKLKLYKLLFKSIRCYGPTSLSSQIIRTCEKVAKDINSMLHERGNAIVVLSSLQSTETFLRFIHQFLPTGPDIDIENEDTEANLHLVRSTLLSLKNMEFPSLGLPTLLQLCTGDYLKYSLGPLYSLCLNSPFEKALPFLNHLADRPVSVKKHAIRLLCILSTREQVSTFMLTFWGSEKNATIKQEIMKQTFKVLNSSSGIPIWEFLKSLIQSLTYKDKACLSEISKIENIERVPPTFLSEYFLLCKEVCCQDKIDKTLKICLLQAIRRNKYRLTNDFFESLINSDIFSNEQVNQIQQEFILLTISYLLSASQEDQSKCLDIIKRNFKRITRPNWTAIYYRQGNARNNSRKLFSFFIEHLCTLSFDISCEGRRYVELFQELQTSEIFFQYKAETFGEYVMLQFTSILHSFGESDTELEEIGRRIGDLLDRYVSEYGKEIIGLFSKLLQIFLRQYCKSKCSNTEQTLQIIKGLLRPVSTDSDSIARRLIASQLFPSTCPHGNVEETYNCLANELLNCNETVVHMFAYNYLSL